MAASTGGDSHPRPPGRPKLADHALVAADPPQERVVHRPMLRRPRRRRADRITIAGPHLRDPRCIESS